ncbi:hypothetical protein [Marinobacter sp.]|uniref:hypothetical protein n=1 Tax=Marinobacter sp. TaxID=50741 RepID=UPI00257D0CEE|nr:hypothetical protein [Marinobacter sp.]|tara:strand:+ start:1169 stop:1606 length:438 start_codon:yes stop_codon:yes gene_type:complete
MDIKDKASIKKSRNILIKSNDPRFNFGIHKEEDIENFHELPDIIDLSKYDYSIKLDNGDDANLPSLVPISQAQAGDRLDELASWFREKYPRLPDEYHGILARYSTGQLLTKKQTKNELKKLDKKPNRKEPVGLEIRQGKFLVDFK